MVSGCFALLHIFFPSFDLYLLTLDVETKAVVDAHVLIRNPHQGEQREQMSAPILIEQLVASDDQKQNYYVLAKAIFTGEKIEKFTPEDVAARLALALAILACLAKDFFMGYGPGNRCNWYGQHKQPNELQDYRHGANSMRWLAGGLAAEGLIASRRCNFTPKRFKEGFAGGI